VSDPLHPRGKGCQNWRWQDGELTVTRSICWSPPGCHCGCGVLLYSNKAGRLVKIEGDPANPFSQGELCPRGLAGLETIYHPDRLTDPLIRVGERGEGKWRKAGWDEALDTIADAFGRFRDESGPESVAFLKGTGRDISPYISRLAYGFGSPNYFALGPANGNACFMPRMSCLYATSGDFQVADCSQYHTDRYDHPGWEPPETILIWGCNPVYSNPDGFLGSWIVRCMKRGTKLIVVDPRLTWLGSRAAYWLPIRPGTDAALALAMLHVIIAEELFDADFCRDWTHGFDALTERVRPCTPEWAQERTGLDPDKIRQAARLFGRSDRAAVQWGIGIDMNADCIPTAHAIACLWSICGQVDNAGGMMIVRHPFGVVRRGAKSASFPQVQADKIGLDRYPLFEHGIPYGQGDALLDQMESGRPYPIRGAWIQSTGTITGSFADPRRAWRAFRKLEFVACCELFMTPTPVSFADVVLPVCTYAERDGLRNSFYQLSAINQAIEPLGESRSDMQICLDMGRRLAPEAFEFEDIQAQYSHMIRHSGVSFQELREQMPMCPGVTYRRYERGELRPDGKPGFNTPTGKIELYSTELERFGLDPLPHFQVPHYDAARMPELNRAYPLQLVTGGRVSVFFNAEHRNVPGLRVFNPYPLVDVHPTDAETWQVEDGLWVWLVSHYGRAKRKVRVSLEVTPGMIHAQASWWNPAGQANEQGGLFDLFELNINNLLPSGLQGKSGFGYPFRNMRCLIERADGPPDGFDDWAALTEQDPDAVVRLDVEPPRTGMDGAALPPWVEGE